MFRWPVDLIGGRIYGAIQYALFQQQANAGGTEPASTSGPGDFWILDATGGGVAARTNTTPRLL